ncbi:hypothetical protein HY479_00905 [Candidatus Uhrbacteria bacterium]|nr:hypothetical protein [Candidatus Uhrbacteria bacterium]
MRKFSINDMAAFSSAAFFFLFVACGTDNNGPTGPGAGGSGGGSGTGGGGSGAQCDDGFSCTIDVFANGSCLHTIGPMSGETACPSGSYCELKKGCIQAPPCAETQDCIDLWKGDACKQKISCDPVSSLCTFQYLDKDEDGHPPPICGGGDCDDSDPDRFPTNIEGCDGVDNDCDGTPDNGATCASPLESCQQGACKCKPANACDINECADILTDPLNCGGCGKHCGPGSCVNGACECGAFTKCGDTCANLKNEYYNCGSCGHLCEADQTCVNGVCKCPNGTDKICDGMCVDTKGNPNHCGACGNICAGAECDCANGECTYEPSCSGGGAGGGA